MEVGKFIVSEVAKSFSHGKESNNLILKEINFEWHEGEVISIMGESGSGKSTIAKMMVGLEKPSEGKIYFDDEDITKWKFNDCREKRKYIQAVFQDSSGTLNNGLSVYKNVEEPLINLTKSKAKERQDIIYNLMKKTDINHNLLKNKPQNLSGGEQRRLALLRALSIKPKFLVLDEVTSGLDYNTENSICEVLKKYHRKLGIAYLIITHDEKIAKSLSTKIFYLQEGRIQ